MKREIFALAALLVGGVGGVQIWVAAGLTATLGILSIFVWLFAAALMAIIALCLLRCMIFYPRVSGNYAYVRAAFGHFYGFMTGWAMLWSEAIMFGILALAAVDFIGLFFKLSAVASIGLKAGFIVLVTALTLMDGRKTPAIWPLIKVLMLFGFIGMAIAFVTTRPEMLSAQWTSNWMEILPALAIAMWAFSGFEITPFLRNNYSAIDMRIVVAIAFSILAAIFISFNFLVQVAGQGVNTTTAAVTSTISNGIGLGIAGIAFAALAALLAFSSPLAVRTPQICNVSRAMAADGMLPNVVTKYKYGDYILWPIISQAIIAFIASMTNEIPGLIYFSFTMLAIALAALSMAYARLRRYYMRTPYEKLTPAYSVGFVIIILLVICSQLPATPMLCALIIFLLGIPFYIHLSSKVENAKLKELVMSEEYNRINCGLIMRSYLGSLLTKFVRWK
ncbi:MAG: hypothetical protein QW751_03020 [Candidatus Aenigmatarchaeota archaeon]